MTDKQMQFLTWLITLAEDKCTSMEELRALNAELRRRSGIQK